MQYVENMQKFYWNENKPNRGQIWQPLNLDLKKKHANAYKFKP